MTATPSIPTGVRVLILSLALHSFANNAVFTIIGKQVFDMTGRELDLGILGLYQFLPIFLAAPLAGTLADRIDRRKVLALGIAVEVAAALAIWRYVATDPVHVGPIFGLIFVYGIGQAIATPASRSLPIDLAPVAIVERVIAVRTVAHQIAKIAGPVAAGFTFVVGIEIPYLGAAIVTAIGALVLLTVPKADITRLSTQPGPRQALRDAVDGVRLIRRHPVLRGAITLDLFAVLFGGAVALLPAIADERLGVGAVGFGWLRAGIGVGALVASLAYAVRPINRHVGRVLLWAIAAFGFATIVLGFTRNFAVAFVAVLVLAGADALSVIIRSTLVPLVTPEEMRGRVLAVESVFIGASNELGAVESGVAGQLLGLVGAVVTGGLATLAVVAVGWRVFPDLRDIDRFSDVAVSRPEDRA